MANAREGGKKVRWRREEHSLQNFYHSSALRVHRELIKISTELSLGVEPTRSAHSLRIDIYISMRPHSGWKTEM